MKTLLILLGLALSCGMAKAGTTAATSADKPSGIFVDTDSQIVTSHLHRHETFYTDSSMTTIDSWDDMLSDGSYNENWNSTDGGKDNYNNQYTFIGTDETVTTNFSSASPANSPVAPYAGDDAVDFVNGYLGSEHTDVQANPAPIDNIDVDNAYEFKEEYSFQRQAQTKYVLLSGGLAIPGVTVLHDFTASAQTIPQIANTPNASSPNGWTMGVDPHFTFPSPSIAVGGFGNLDADGHLYKEGPADLSGDATPHVGGDKHYTFSQATHSAYTSKFEVFVHQPWPNYPNDHFNNDPEDPLYNPQPPDYPYVNGADVGHAWWKLVTDASEEAIKKYTTSDCSYWANQELGYGPEGWTLLNVLDAIHHINCPEAEGEFPFSDNVAKDVDRTFDIHFMGMIGGLNHCEALFKNHGTYDLCTHNCVSETKNTGAAAGLSLPDDWDPEHFGYDIKAMSSQ